MKWQNSCYSCRTASRLQINLRIILKNSNLPRHDRLAASDISRNFSDTDCCDLRFRKKNITDSTIHITYFETSSLFLRTFTVSHSNREMHFHDSARNLYNRHEF